jgi:hypothetical protein
MDSNNNNRIEGALLALGAAMVAIVLFVAIGMLIGWAVFSFLHWFCGC